MTIRTTDRRFVGLLAAVILLVGTAIPAAAQDLTVLGRGAPTIDLPTPNVSSVPHAVAYHPGFDLYYGADSGSTDRRGWVWGPDGSVIQDFPPPIGVDVRGLFYDPGNDAIEAVTFGAVTGDGGNVRGLVQLELTGAGLYTGGVVNLLASLPGLDGSQTLPSFDAARNQLYSRSSTATVNVVDATTGLLLDQITLDLAAAGNPTLQDGFLGYDEDADALVALDPTGQRALAFERDGTFLGATALSGVDPVNDNGNTGYANGQIFVYDGAGTTYHGFQVFGRVRATAERTIDLPTPDRASVPHAVAYHPGFRQYYGADSGSVDRRGWVWSATGVVVQNFPPPIGVDVRGLYYNPDTDAVEAASFDAVGGDGGGIEGILALGLDGAGLYTGASTNLLASVPGLAGSQTLPAFDPSGVLYSRSSGSTVNIASRATGTLLGSIELDLAAAGNPSLQDNFIGYDPAELALVALDPTAETAVVFALDGSYLGTSQLSGVDPVLSSGNTGYANGQLFVFDGGNETYHGFRVFVPEPDGGWLAALGALAGLGAVRRRR